MNRDGYKMTFDLNGSETWIEVSPTPGDPMSIVEEPPGLMTASAIGIIRHPTDPDMLITVKAEKVAYGDIIPIQRTLMEAVRNVVESARFDGEGKVRNRKVEDLRDGGRVYHVSE